MQYQTFTFHQTTNTVPGMASFAWNSNLHLSTVSTLHVVLKEKTEKQSTFQGQENSNITFFFALVFTVDVIKSDFLKPKIQ